VDPEAALRDAGGKFETRFRSVEASLAEDGRTAADASMAELEALWARAKQEAG
jgi:ATP diphosphatase